MLRGESHVRSSRTFRRQSSSILSRSKSLPSAVDYEFDADSCLAYIESLQDKDVFDIAEIWLIRSMLQLELLLELSAMIESLAGRVLQPEIRQRLGDLCGSLDSLRIVDWKSLFLSVSITEKILCEDPSGAYGRMEFQSCASYREAIQELARFSETSERDIVRQAIAMAEQGLRRFPANSRNSLRYGHVGYYLVGRGRAELERKINYAPHGKSFIRRILLGSS